MVLEWGVESRKYMDFWGGERSVVGHERAEKKFVLIAHRPLLIAASEHYCLVAVNEHAIFYV
jgi:hypothetical protein